MLKEAAKILLKTLTEHWLKTLLGIGTVTTIFSIWDHLSNLLFEYLPLMPKRLLPMGLLLILGLLLLVVALFTHVFNLRKKLKLNLFPKFNVLWDSNRQPHCPICQKLLQQPIINAKGQFAPLVQVAAKIANQKLFCKQCNQQFLLVDETGCKLNIEEAIKKLS